jgi:hypothetical protein
MQPTFQRRVPVPLCIAASFGIAPAGDEPCASLHPVRFAVRRSVAASVVGSLRRAALRCALSSVPPRDRRLGSDIPVASRPRPLSGSGPRDRHAEGRGRVHHVSVKEPWLVRPGMPSIVERPFSGSAPVPRLCRRDPSPGFPSLVAVARFELAARPPTRPRPDWRLGGSCHSPTSAIAKSTSTPASDPSLHRHEPVKGSSRCAPRVAPRSARRRRSKRNRGPADAEAPLRRPRARRVSVRAAADRPARRASDTSWSPRRPIHCDGVAGIRVATV